jgi:hypothetical protein
MSTDDNGRYPYPDIGWGVSKMKKIGQQKREKKATAAREAELAKLSPEQREWESKAPDLGPSASGKAEKVISDRKAVGAVSRPALMAAEAYKLYKHWNDESFVKIREDAMSWVKGEKTFGELMEKMQGVFENEAMEEGMMTQEQVDKFRGEARQKKSLANMQTIEE